MYQELLNCSLPYGPHPAPVRSAFVVVWELLGWSLCKTLILSSICLFSAAMAARDLVQNPDGDSQHWLVHMHRSRAYDLLGHLFSAHCFYEAKM